MASILIKLPNWMGDILFAYDLLYTLSMKFDRLGLLTLRQHADIHRVFPIPRSTIIPHDPQVWPQLDRETVLQIEDFNPDLGLVLPNSIGASLSLRLAGISPLLGYATEHRGFLLKRKLAAPNHRMHQSLYFLTLLELFGARPVSYPIDIKETKQNLIVIHPGASKMERAWSLDRFKKLAQHLRKEGFTVKFVASHPIEGEEALVHPPLWVFAELLRDCSLFIGNDSGPLHLAQQCGAAVLGIYGPGDPRITGPRTITPSRIVYHSFPCSPCRQRFFRECDPSSEGKPYCIDTISSEEVIRMAMDLIHTAEEEETKV